MRLTRLALGNNDRTCGHLSKMREMQIIISFALMSCHTILVLKDHVSLDRLLYHLRFGCPTAFGRAGCRRPQ